ncbi:MAG: hypothetical protein J6A79_17250, partial [Clostridia bacterium]|nr:hypothetical protein [Clostridia bacterium]
DLGYVFLSDGTQREGTAYTQNKDIDFIIDHLLGDANVQDATQARFLESKTPNLIQINDCPLRGVA